MGATCSTTRQDEDLVAAKDCGDLVDGPRDDSLTANISEDTDEASSRQLKLDKRENDSVLQDLLKMVQQPGLAFSDISYVSASCVRYWAHQCAKPSVSDAEALAVYSILSRVMSNESCWAAAKDLKERGYPSEAMACLRYVPHDVMAKPAFQSLIHEIQSLRCERWSRIDAEIVEYTKFWESFDVAEAIDLCEDSLDGILRQMNEEVFPGATSKFGVDGMCDDSPLQESLGENWSKEGSLNYAEQEKAIALSMKHTRKLGNQRRQRIENVFRFQQEGIESSLLPSRLHSKMTCRFLGVRFIKVCYLLRMDELIKYEDMHSDCFTEEGHFAVSYRFDSLGGRDSRKTLLERLKKVLSKTEGVNPNDGVFIDWCCAPARDPVSVAFAKSIFEQCHVIFLPCADYFTRSWCTFECMAWLLSPFPNQALGDYNLWRCISLMSAYHFGRPPFVLDRPELQVLGRVCMGMTDSAVPGEKDFLVNALGNNHVKSTSLRESLTKVTFKFHSTLVVD